MPILNTFGVKINESVLDEGKFQCNFNSLNMNMLFQEGPCRTATSNYQR